jgi:hypothetical protein
MALLYVHREQMVVDHLFDFIPKRKRKRKKKTEIDRARKSQDADSQT